MTTTNKRRSGLPTATQALDTNAVRSPALKRHHSETQNPDPSSSTLPTTAAAPATAVTATVTTTAAAAATTTTTATTTATTTGTTTVSVSMQVDAPRARWIVNDTQSKKSLDVARATSQHIFVVDCKYDLITSNVLGIGTYGVVASAIVVDEESKNATRVAIKKLRRLFMDTNDWTDEFRNYREIRLLQQLNHPNIIRLHDVLEPSTSEFRDGYIVVDRMDTDLVKLLRYPNSRATIEIGHVKYIFHQLVCAVRYLHSAGIVHRDLAPANILVNQDVTVRLCDFGLAKPLGEGQPLTEYVTTRWYRAPECICGRRDYNETVDIWSLGCILAELLTKKPLFPGSNQQDQLQRIFRLIGSPTDETLKRMASPACYKAVNSWTPVIAKPQWASQLISSHINDADACDLLQKLLVLHPDKRLALNDVLEHPFLAQYRTREFETIRSTKVMLPLASSVTSARQLQELYWQEIIRLRPSVISRYTEWNTRSVSLLKLPRGSNAPTSSSTSNAVSVDSKTAPSTLPALAPATAPVPTSASIPPALVSNRSLLSSPSLSAKVISSHVSSHSNHATAVIRPIPI